MAAAFSAPLDHEAEPDAESLLLAKALRIAARVLDEGAVERLASVMSKTYVCGSCGRLVGDDCCDRPVWYEPTHEHRAQAVINYLLEGKE